MSLQHKTPVNRVFPIQNDIPVLRLHFWAKGQIVVDDGDILPNGFRYLQRGFKVNPSGWFHQLACVKIIRLAAEPQKRQPQFEKQRRILLR